MQWRQASWALRVPQIAFLQAVVDFYHQGGHHIGSGRDRSLGRRATILKDQGIVSDYQGKISGLSSDIPAPGY